MCVCVKIREHTNIRDVLRGQGHISSLWPLNDRGVLGRVPNLKRKSSWIAN